MKRIKLTIVFVLGVGTLVAINCWDRLTVRESGHGFVVGDHLVLGEYGYSQDGDRLRWGIFRTWPKDSTPAERRLDNRVARDSLGWPLIRAKDGRMIPVGTDGNIYFFEGTNLKTIRVRMNEHTDTMPLDNLKTLNEVWTYLQQFRVHPGEERTPN